MKLFAREKGDGGRTCAMSYDEPRLVCAHCAVCEREGKGDCMKEGGG